MHVLSCRVIEVALLEPMNKHASSNPQNHTQGLQRLKLYKTKQAFSSIFHLAWILCTTNALGYLAAKPQCSRELAPCTELRNINRYTGAGQTYSSTHRTAPVLRRR